MDRKNIVVFDFETGSRFPDDCEILSIGACIIHRNTFEIVDEFESLMKPLDFDALDPDALKVNGLTKEQLEDAPERNVVFPSWIEWIKKYNTARDKSFFGAPVPCGYNIDAFDFPIFNRYCKELGYWNEKDRRQEIMWPINRIDVMQYVWLFTRTNVEIKSRRLEKILAYMGVDQEEIDKGAHDALWDVKQTARIAIKFLKLAKWMTAVDPATRSRKLEMKGCLADG